MVPQAAADAAPSAMLSVIGLDSDKVAALCDAANEEVSEDERVQIANFLCPVCMLDLLKKLRLPPAFPDAGVCWQSESWGLKLYLQYEAS